MNSESHGRQQEQEQRSERPHLCTMVDQWQHCLGRRRAFGDSSRMARSRSGVAPGRRIRSTGYEAHLLRTGSAFLRYAFHQDADVDRLADLRPRHGQAWVDATRSPNTQADRMHVLRVMEDLLREELGLHLHLVPRRQPVRAKTGGTGQFTPEEQAALIRFARESKNPALADALQYGAALGLRPSEIEAVKAGDFDAEAHTLHIPGLKWAHPRDISVPVELQEGLAQLTVGKNPGDRLFPNVSTPGLERIVARAVKSLNLSADETGHRSVMAFRGARAQAIYEAAMAEGLSSGDARRRVAVELGHGHTEINPRIDIARDHYLNLNQA